jgi:hypothetical protein
LPLTDDPCSKVDVVREGINEHHREVLDRDRPRSPSDYDLHDIQF